MPNTSRFICQFVFSLGFLTLLGSVLFRLWEARKRTRFRRHLDLLYGTSSSIYEQFNQWLIQDNVRDGENFLLTELKRRIHADANVDLHLMQSFTHVFMQQLLALKAEAEPAIRTKLHGLMKTQVYEAMASEHHHHRRASYRNLGLILITPVVASAFFLPLLFYTYLLVMQTISPSLLLLLGLGSLISAGVIVTRFVQIL